MHSNLAGMQVWHSYYTMPLHIKLLMKTWLMQLMVVKVLNKKLINAHLDNVFLWKTVLWLFPWSTNFVQVLLWKYSFQWKYINVFLYLSVSLYMHTNGCLGFVFEKYLATSNKNLFSTAPIPVLNLSMFGTVWGNSLKSLSRWIANISFPEIKEK